MTDAPERIWLFADGAITTKKPEKYWEANGYIREDIHTTALAAKDADIQATRNQALEEAIDAVHYECWTDGPASETLLAEQATTSLAISAIRALKPAETTTITKDAEIKRLREALEDITPAMAAHVLLKDADVLHSFIGDIEVGLDHDGMSLNASVIHALRALATYGETK